ncbi:hypothetical protein IIU_05606 [Bacillus cereus VD133]|uniref:Uncharacterized protein n=1 Tax=Bacillus cereus VD133 TaxID=1053233 RepID=A0A9W5PLR4_BACCE|nr:hypothetical protein [Bacillus cereus]EOO28925.1 hypothetical protein IIU_05606 [Bacillus cereus VD133]
MLKTIGVDVKKLELIEKILLLEKETECEAILKAISEVKKEIDGK